MEIVRGSPQIFAGLGKPGPTSEGPRLVLKKKNWVSKKGIHHEGEAHWYVKDGDKIEFSTKCRQAQEDKARQVLAVHIAKKAIGLVGKHAPGHLTFKELLKDHEIQVRRLAVSSQQKRHADVVGHQCVRLSRFFGNMTVEDYVAQESINFMAEYIAERVAFYESHPKTGEKDPETTADMLLRLLRKATKSYVSRHGLLWSKEIHVPKKRRGKKKKPRRWLRKQEANILLWACIFEYDKQTRRFKTREITLSDGTTRRVLIRHTGKKAIKLYFFSRIFRYMWETAARHETTLMTMYGARPDMPGIECDGEGRGKVHRRGYGEEDTNKARPTSPIHERLRRLVRIWSRMDGHIDRATGKPVTDGVERYLILDKDLHPYRNHINTAFNDFAREYCGLSNDVTVHTLKHTSVNWAYQAGHSLAAAEVMLGTSQQTLRGYYTDWKDDSSHGEILKSYDDPVRRKAFRAIRHADPLKVPRHRRFAAPFKPRKSSK
jgi:hypothetical protein